ncbi:MAG: tail fiber domain-containing protein [Alphaproteobacteria bacterium]|nr:tail fiber domain-containing protein [Alphaproteobacteria bacterium]
MLKPTDGAGASLNVNGTTYTSDKRLKTDIAPISKDSAMSLINKLEPKRFHWHPDSEQGKINKNYDFGMMAQDVQKILPEVVIETDSTGPDLASGKKKKAETLNEKLGKTLAIDYTHFVNINF